MRPRQSELAGPVTLEGRLRGYAILPVGCTPSDAARLLRLACVEGFDDLTGAEMLRLSKIRANIPGVIKSVSGVMLVKGIQLADKMWRDSLNEYYLTKDY